MIPLYLNQLLFLLSLGLSHDTKPVIKEKPFYTTDEENTVRLYISSNSLAVAKIEPVATMSDLSIIIEGDDTSYYIVSGTIKDIERLIDLCCNARDREMPVEIITECGSIIKFS